MKTKIEKSVVQLGHNEILQKGDKITFNGKPLFIVDGWADHPFHALSHNREDYTATREIGEKEVPMTDEDFTTVIPGIDSDQTIKVKPSLFQGDVVIVQGDDLIVVPGGNVEAFIDAVRLACEGGAE